jgi:hypothetical protein
VDDLEMLPDICRWRDALLAGAKAALAAIEMLRLPMTDMPESHVSNQYRANWAEKLRLAEIGVKGAAEAFGIPMGSGGGTSCAVAASAAEIFSTVSGGASETAE